MNDPNLIAWLYPAISENEGLKGKHTWQAIRMNISGYIPPQEETKSHFRSRESTVSLEDEEDNAPNDTSYLGLQLTFNRGPKAGKGLVLGTDPNCDIVLPQLLKISRFHCALTFDAQRRLILRDFSKYGTIVTYNGKGGESRRTIVTCDDEGRESCHYFTWILGGHAVPRKTDKILIEIQGISFQIIVSTHDENPRLYNSNVDRFLQEAKANEELPFNGLGIQSLNSTAPPSGTQTPGQDPIRLEQETLGKGAFAVVRRFWDVSTGLDYAYKEPHDPKKFDRKMWEKEADIMSQISHGHVVELMDVIFMPWPRLILEYVPFGSLEDLTNLSVVECVTILCQGLSALVDLHEHEEPIVHRDIKPGNILVQSRNPLHIKFTDFGLSRVSKDLTTFCGTALYLAPEVYTKESYTPVVDIWSFGVVVFKLAYGLPNNHGYKGWRWCRKIATAAKDWDSEALIDFLTDGMLVIDPKRRHSAQECYRDALRLVLPTESRAPTPTPTSFHEDERTSRSANSLLVATIKRHTRSAGPPPDSCPSTYVGTRKRSVPSSSGRHTKRQGNVVSTCYQQPEEVEPVLELFGEGWLQDPNCVGSSVAAMGDDLSDSSSWGNASEPLEDRIPGRLLDLADEEANDHYPYSIPGRLLEPTDEEENGYDPLFITGGNNHNPDPYLVNYEPQDLRGDAWTDSEAYMNARLREALAGGESL